MNNGSNTSFGYGSSSHFDLQNYEPVENRIRAFWQKFPQGRLITDLQRTERSDGRIEWICRTEAFTNQEDARPQATGFATEIEGSTPINRSNASENCETSSIGRCLANLGFAAKGKRPSREEMAKVARNQSQQRKPNNKNSAEPSAPERKPLTPSDWEALIESLSHCATLPALKIWSAKAASFTMTDEKRVELLARFKEQRQKISAAA
ncbi:MAG: hypothetical protein ACO27S_03190 [Candidatus Nanopelagicaceae bacterium]|jgi:hypothetical protein